MVELYAADINELYDESLLARRLCGERAGEYARIKPERTRRQCLAAGLLLLHRFGSDSVEKNPYGKPYIPGEAEFSISHSGDAVLLAVSETPVGADIELISDRDTSRIAKRAFCAEESAFIEASEDKRRAFFDIWTRKESYMKAVGRGFDLPMESFSVIPDVSGAMRGVGDGFCFYTLDIDGYSAAVCSREAGTADIEWLRF